VKCPKCRFANTEGAKFCNECGAKLELICPSCAKVNLPGSKFCNECGQPLTAAMGVPPDYSKPQSYTPKFLADRILTTRSAMEGERKLVTVLFADVANFTSISEKLDPEEIHEIMDGCFKILMDEIHKYEGTINQFTGDGVMALFGAPLAHEDHAQRACHAALAIQSSLDRYGQRLKEDLSIDFKMRIGLNSGPVVVGAIGDDLRMDYTAIGDTINLASRMQTSAAPGAILVSAHTHRLAKDFFAFTSLGKLPMKGKEEPQDAFILLSRSEVKTRIEASASAGLTRFIGRTREMETLSEILDKARSGSGQVVGIVGEAGVGKSRIILEVKRLFPDTAFLEGRCLHYGSSMAYLPILDILRSYFGIKEGEQELTLRRKIKEKISSLDEKLRTVLPPFFDLLSLKVDDAAYMKLEPKEKREKIFEALRDLFIRECQSHPLILIVEDLHWIDKTSEEFLDYLIGWLANTRILLVLLYRPEYTHRWGNKSYFTAIRVDQLPLSTSAELVQSILSGGEIVPELKNLILSKAAGNPLFMEELTHSLLENGSIEMIDNQYLLKKKPADIEIPDTIQGIIAARMDRLDESLKRIMHVAAVIGREFAFRLLQAILEMKEELKAQLLNLQGLEFIYEKRLFPELEYVFKHALTQEVAYNSLLLTRRREIHERIGHAIEEIYPDRLEEFYEMLAYHYSRSDNKESAYHYAKLSGGKAMQSCSNQEAFQYYKDAFTILKEEPGTAENKRELLDVVILMATPMHRLNYPENSSSILEEGERLVKEVGDKKSIATLYSFISLFHLHSGNPALGREYLEEAFREAEKIGDIEIIARVAPNLCISYGSSGNYAKIPDVALQVIALLEKTHRERDFFTSQWNAYAVLHALYGQSLGLLGEFAKGEQFCEKGLSLAREINHLFSIGLAEIYYEALFLEKGDGEKALWHAQSAIEYLERSQAKHLLPIAWGLLGSGYHLLGNLDSALESAEKALKMQRDTGLPLYLSLHHATLGRIHADTGNWSEARLHAEQALALARTNHERYVEGRAWILLGSVIGKTEPSNTQKAEEHILQGMKIADELKIKPYYAQGCFALGKLYAGAGHKEKARENLTKARAMFEEMGMDYYLAQANKLLESLEMEAGS
jgi:class 3 adenylate cyclase/tetratricopeptide (TPR) repeat protein